MDIRTLPEHERAIYNNLSSRYSLHFEPFKINGKTIRVLQVSDLEELLDGKDPFEDVSQFPFWARIWESSVVLAHVLAAAPERQNHGRLLALGSCLSVPGLAAAQAGFNVVLSDYEETVLDFQRVSSAASGLEGVESINLDWLDPPELGAFDVIAGAEILFKEEFLDPLLDLCHNYLKPEGTIYLSHDVRRKCLPLFLERAQESFHIGSKKQTISRNGVTSDILVNRLKRK